MEVKLSYLSADRNVKLMRILGIYPADPDSPKLQRTLHTIYRCIVLLLATLYITQQILKIYQVRNDADKVIGIMFFLLTYTDYIYKIIVMARKSREIEDIFQVMKGSVYNQGEPEHRAPLLKTVETALKIVRTFNGMAFVVGCLWAIQPTIMHIQGKTIELPIWLPYDINSNPQFYLTLVYTYFQTTCQGIGNTTIDVFIAFLLEQCKTQITILRLNLESIVEKSHKEKSSNFLHEYEKRFKKIMMHHSVIVNVASKIQDIFSGAVFYQFIVGGWILCTSAYKMVNINPISLDFLSMIIYINCILIELFLYCYYGNEISVESEMLTKSTYALDWLSLPVKHRRTLVIFMERIKKPIEPMAGSIIPLSNKTFVSILRSSYTFYAFLKNSDKSA